MVSWILRALPRRRLRRSCPCLRSGVCIGSEWRRPGFFSGSWPPTTRSVPCTPFLLWSDPQAFADVWLLASSVLWWVVIAASCAIAALLAICWITDNSHPRLALAVMAVGLLLTWVWRVLLGGWMSGISRRSPGPGSGPSWSRNCRIPTEARFTRRESAASSGVSSRQTLQKRPIVGGVEGGAL